MNDSTSAEVEQGSPSQSLFFQLLHNMISNESHTGVIDWTPDGEAFAVLLKTEFEDNILPLYFPHARYTVRYALIYIFQDVKKCPPNSLS